MTAGLTLTPVSTPMVGPVGGTMMHIGELAQRAGVSRRSLRYYEQHGLLHSDRNHKGWRVYSEVALARVANVRDLLAAGLRIEDVQRLAPCLERDLERGPACSEAIETYTSRVAELDERIAALTRHRAALAARLDALVEQQRDDARGNRLAQTTAEIA